MTGRAAEILIGSRYGRLVVTAYCERIGGRNAKVMARCDCGSEVAVWKGALRNGDSQSCGCKKRDYLIERATKHGMHTTKAYRAWQGMKARCTNPKHHKYPDYGGRGISFCTRWGNFENFFADMGAPPLGTSIDRYPNNDGNYEPGNCRWATPGQQQRNTRSNRNITVGSETFTMKEWSERSGVPYEVLRGRLRIGWTPERALMADAKGLGA